MEVSESLLRDLEAADVDVRRRAAHALLRPGTATGPVAAALVRAAADIDEQVAESANEALENLGPPPIETIVDLIALLNAETPQYGYWSATLLGRLGPTAIQAVEPLRVALESHPELSVRERCAWALGKIGPDAGSAQAALQQAAKSNSPRLARLAQEALAAIKRSS